MIKTLDYLAVINILFYLSFPVVSAVYSDSWLAILLYIPLYFPYMVLGNFLAAMQDILINRENSNKPEHKITVSTNVDPLNN